MKGGVWWILTRAVGSPKIFILMGYFCQRYVMFELQKYEELCREKVLWKTDEKLFFSKDIPIPCVVVKNDLWKKDEKLFFFKRYSYSVSYYLLLQRFLYLLAIKVKLRWEIIFCNRQILNETALFLKTDVSTWGAEKRGIRKLLNSKRI